jgi:putative hydrolase of the HAD superfamily
MIRNVVRKVCMPESGKIDIVLFDVGGVMLTNGWDHNERTAVLDQFNLDREEFESRHPEANDAWERDAIGVEDYLEATVFYEPRSFTKADFIKAMKARSVPLTSNAMPVLKELAATRKYFIGLLNNESRVLHEYRMETYGLKPYFSVQLSSCYLGMRKPHAEIYRRALDILSRPAGSILFIDDRAGNTDAARAAGINAIQFFNEEQLRAELKQLQVI